MLCPKCGCGEIVALVEQVRAYRVATVQPSGPDLKEEVDVGDSDWDKVTGYQCTACEASYSEEELSSLDSAKKLGCRVCGDPFQKEVAAIAPVKVDRERVELCGSPSLHPKRLSGAEKPYVCFHCDRRLSKRDIQALLQDGDCLTPDDRVLI